MRAFLRALLLTVAVAVASVVPVDSAQPTPAFTAVAGVAPTTLSAPAGPKAQALAGLSLSPAEQTVQALTDFTLDVVVNCGTHADGAGLVVTFDPLYMQVIAVTPDKSGFPNVMQGSFDNRAGTIVYDAGASLMCHAEGTCPSGVIRVATVTFRATARTHPISYVGLLGQVFWAGELVFDGEGDGSTITITPSAGIAYLPLVVRGRAY